MSQRERGVWRLNDSGLPTQQSVFDARDTVVECFAATHSAHFIASKAQLGLPTSAEAVRTTAEGIVRIAFNQVGGSFDHPTTVSLERVIDLLAARSLSWGTPADVVCEQQAMLQSVLARTERATL